MSTLRKLIFGETWFLPLGIALVVGLAAIAAATLETAWREAGGPVLLIAVVVLLGLAVRRG